MPAAFRSGPRPSGKQVRKNTGKLIQNQIAIRREAKKVSKNNIKDTLKKIRKLTPTGMTVELAKKAVERLKKDSKGDTLRDRLKQPLKKEDKFKRSRPDAERMPLPKGEKPKIDRTPLPKGEKPKFEFLKQINPLKMQPSNKNKGGRVGLKSGTRGCKLAMKGRGRAYGKNS